MKKKVAVLAVLEVFLLLFGLAATVQAREIWNTPESYELGTQLTFLKVRDEYQLRYGLKEIPSTAVSSRLNFWSNSGNYFDLLSQNKPSGIYYLTCNGTYILELLDASGNRVAETKQLVTTKIVSPSCSSRDGDQTLKNDLNVQGATQTDGTIRLTWPAAPGAIKYDIYKDGERVGETTGTTYDVTSPGSYTVIAIGDGGSDDVLGESDYVTPPDYTGEGGSSGGCNACQWLTDALACPAWDDYMGELTDAIRAALPPPPDWDTISQTFVDKFADYFGDVPTPPSRSEIDSNITPTLPPLDTSVPDADITPIAPSEYNDGPIDFDITDTPEIEIVDESAPIEIYEPDKYINSDGPDVMVFPGDPRNHSDGIKQPDTVDSLAPMPVPVVPESEQPAQPEIPQAEMPTPGGTEETIPIPGGTDGIIPIPKGG